MSKRIRVSLLLTLLAPLWLAACSTAPVQPVRDASSELQGDQALVAFSVSATRPFLLRRLELLTLEDGQGAAGGPPVLLPVEEAEAGLYLFRAPAGSYRFGSVRIAAEDGWWETRHPGPAFTAEAGSLTYLGRIQLHSVRLSSNVEGTKRYLTGVNLRVEDRSDEDTGRLVSEFSLPGDMPVRTAVSGAWSDSEYQSVAYRQIPGRDFQYENFYIWGVESGPVGPAPPAATQPAGSGGGR